MRRHAIVTMACAAAVAWWLRTLAVHASNAVPGSGPGDNLSFVWNVWWARFALTHPGQHLFSSPLLFHPFGVDLTLHTHTLLPALAVSWIGNPMLAQNVLVFAHLFLNFICAHALAYRETRNAWTASVAAVIFGWSPYLAAHLEGHFNLIAAWVLPLSALAALRVSERPSVPRGLVLGLVLGATAYVDYYYFVYAVVLTMVLVFERPVVVRRTTPRRPIRLVTMLFAGLLLIDGLVAAAILLTGGLELHVGGITISARSLRNPAAAAWLLGCVWFCIWIVRHVRARVDPEALRSAAVPLIAAMTTLALALLPLVVRGLGLVRAGEYVTQPYFWRSAPSGVDLVTLLLGNPFNFVYGHASLRAYRALGVNLVEQVAWLGPTVIVLAILAMRRRAETASRWIPVLALFGLWSLGPYVRIAAHDTPLWLPAVVVRWIPIVSNARIPSRAIVVVYLACAMLCAHGVTWLRTRRRGRAMAAILLALLLIDYTPGPTAVYETSMPSTYDPIVSDRASGAVCELPLGIRDGFGELGKLDARVLYYQTRHERPILGGFLARLPRTLPERYDALPIAGSLLRLSSGGSLSAEHVEPDRARAASVLMSLGIRYIVLNKATSPPDLVVYVHRTLPLRLIAEDEIRAVYLIDASAF